MRRRKLARFVGALLIGATLAGTAGAADAVLAVFRFRAGLSSIDTRQSPDFQAGIARARAVAGIVSDRPDIVLVLEQDASLTGRDARFSDARTAAITAALGLATTGQAIIERFAPIGDPDAARLLVETTLEPVLTCPWFIDVHLPAAVGGGTIRLPVLPDSRLRLPEGATATFETSASAEVHASRLWRGPGDAEAQPLTQPIGRSAAVTLRLSAHPEPAARGADAQLASRAVADHATAAALADSVDCVVELGR